MVVKARISKMLDIKTIRVTALRCVCSTGTRTSDLTVGVAECTSRFVLVCLEVKPMVLPTCGTDF